MTEELKQMCDVLTGVFGINNVSTVKVGSGENSYIRVRPMWIEGAGDGYKPTLSDMFSQVNSALSINGISEKNGYKIENIYSFNYMKINSVVVQIYHGYL